MKRLGLIDQVVADAVVATYKPVNTARAVRRAFWSVAVGIVLLSAAMETGGALSVALSALLVLRFLPYLLMGVAQRVKDEHAARLAQLPEGWRAVLTTKTRLFSKGRS